MASASAAVAAPSAQGVAHKAVCPGAPSGFAHCDSQVVTDASGAPLATATPSGFGPADLQSAYALATAAAGAGGGRTIAIVDAYDDPNAESDLAVYRAQYGLPACTTANGCFKKVNQAGVQGSYPRADGGWAQEISLDVDMASAVCPNCKILLVEAKTNSFANLSTAVDTAAALGASTISNSYGGSEYASEVTDQSHYNHPGIAVTVSSGDNGYGVEFPAASQYVTAVGGTSLKKVASTRGWAETAWSGAGSGCSAYIAKPSWQKDTGCSKRTVADVSAVADPNTGVAVYDSFRGSGGWLVFGGTSVSAPVIAGVYALAGNTVSDGSYPYLHTSDLFDVTSGSNGTCGGSYLCTATTGFDGPTGLGTPNGVGAF
ncbi:S53 family peptidase [Paraconexibacter antarcticus]|uniref:S53 family peptidase n=1 Tax=Paraconexibacter antarcticus TaxID=2949664 RepID=A0ABY5DTX2_9ACTN|nr:S53 family peptidase [Paraconexibacter antarcticus]UTI64364.1 S53 family peptidase [Paraconexibacter antarcticus]